MTYQRALIAADDAIRYVDPEFFPNKTYTGSNRTSFRTRSLNRTSGVADRKFRQAVHLLGDLEKDFPSMDPTSDQKIGGMVSGEAKMDDTSKYALMVLSVLKKDLHANVKFLTVSLPPNADK